MAGTFSRDTRIRAALAGMFFASGFVALVYEVLWLRDLRLVFGSGAHAAASTLAVFFSGMAAGSAFFGLRAAKAVRPLRLYAGLEIAIATTALLSFALPSAHVWIYAAIVHGLGGGDAALVLARLLLSFAFLLPPAFFMGGTLPVIGEVFVRRPAELAATTGRLYALNTAGAAIGAFAAGFLLPVWLGFRTSYAAAIGLNVGLATMAWMLSRTHDADPMERPGPVPADTPIPTWLGVYAFGSGFATIGLEVLWTRMFALVLNSSVYAFSAILVVFLAALATGAALSMRLLGHVSRDLHLFALLLGAGLTVGVSPFALQAATGQLGSIPTDWGFGAYVVLVFGTASLVVLPPAAFCGAVLPGLWRYCEDLATRPGVAIGRLVAFNTAGGVFGSLAAGFVLLPTFGLWRSVSLLAFLYLALAVFAVQTSAPAARHLRPAALVAAVLLGTFLDPTRLTLVRTDPGEKIERIWETPRGIVAVTRDHGGRRIRLDNAYILGGTEGRDEEAWQADLPLALHGAARRVFFIGLGSGITAATALEHPVDSVTATELLPEVVAASREYFADETGALFTDDRAQVIAADGRMVLATSDDRWDVIVSDLFVPWHEGTGSLYTRENFEIIRRHLADGGVFVQWLPLFQLTRSDFDTITGTMLDVFDDVSLWHADFRDGTPIAALVAGTPLDRLPPSAATERAEFFADISAHRALFADAPRNTDDHPTLEHRAPLSQAAVRSGSRAWLVGDELERLEEDLRDDADPR